MEFNSTPFDRFDPFDSLALWPLSLGNKTPFEHLTRLNRMESIRSGVASVDNWRGEYLYNVFCIINFF